MKYAHENSEDEEMADDHEKYGRSSLNVESEENYEGVYIDK